MQLLFPAHSAFELAFKVAIAGTAALPQSVSVVLERDGKALSFKAHPTADGWASVIDNPGALFADGADVNVSVNVIVNHRLFVPLKTTAHIDFNSVTAEPELPAESIEQVKVAKEVEIEEPLEVRAADKEPINVPVARELAKTSSFANIFKDISRTAPITFEAAPVVIAPMKSKLAEAVKTTKRIQPKQVLKDDITVKSSPVTVSLFKTLDTSFTIKPLNESKVVKLPPVAHKSSPFKIKRTKIVYK